MDPKEGRKPRERAGEWGKLAGRLVKNAGPRTRQLLDDSRPKVEKAIQDTRPRVEKAIHDARPRVEKAFQDYRPKVEQAGRDAVRYAQEHEDELKSMALRGARMRLGPLGMAIDALGIGGPPAKPSGTALNCATCNTANATNARFCVECGAELTARPAGGA
jgi:vacuolar-type H+-ATPase subunit H